MADADALLGELEGKPEHDKWPSGANRGVARVSYTHDAMVDAIIANPVISQNELAAYFGYTPSWVSQIMASDSFQARLAERTADLVDPTLRASVQERFKALVTRSMAILMEKLDRPASSIPDNLAIRSLELGSRALGYGAKDIAPPPTQVNMHVHLENLAGGLTTLLRRKRTEALDGEVDGQD